ncbi:hypothetical protein SUGI_0493620 [Cryptomeria japonica]|nr:hypothetical protein SUGI_0493620 [Cryptomeria japonica]
MQPKWPKLKLSSPPPEKCKVSHSLVKWKSPKHFRWKLNFYGATKGNSGIGRAGYIIQDLKGAFIWVASKKLTCCTNNTTECEALTLGIKLCLKLGIDEVEIEGNSLLCIRPITMCECQSWYLGKWIELIKISIKKLRNYSIQHIYQETNYAANCIANQVVNQLQEIVDGSNADIWIGIHNILDSDWAGNYMVMLP